MQSYIWPHWCCFFAVFYQCAHVCISKAEVGKDANKLEELEAVAKVICSRSRAYEPKLGMWNAAQRVKFHCSAEKGGADIQISNIHI